MSCSSDEQTDKECPLCVEALQIDDLNFFPCKCAYQICRFCWHRIRTDYSGLCPACRVPYTEDPVNFEPLSSAELKKIRHDKKLKAQAERQKVHENRKQLSSFRVLQKNLVYVVGLPSRIADPDVLKKPEYFGKFGKILKVVLGAGTSTLPNMNVSHTAYVTYSKVEEALRAIQTVNNIPMEGRTIRVSLGTTKYCASFLKCQPCQKQDCMYLHEVADSDISFTKEDMHQGKHSEYEKQLLEQFLINSSRLNTIPAVKISSSTRITETVSEPSSEESDKTSFAEASNFGSAEIENCDAEVYVDERANDSVKSEHQDEFVSNNSICEETEESTLAHQPQAATETQRLENHFPPLPSVECSAQPHPVIGNNVAPVETSISNGSSLRDSSTYNFAAMHAQPHPHPVSSYADMYRSMTSRTYADYNVMAPTHTQVVTAVPVTPIRTASASPLTTFRHPVIEAPIPPSFATRFSPTPAQIVETSPASVPSKPRSRLPMWTNRTEPESPDESAAAMASWRRMLGLRPVEDKVLQRRPAESHLAPAPGLPTPPPGFENFIPMPMRYLHARNNQPSNTMPIPAQPNLSDDDLGFDPLKESLNGLAAMLEEEKQAFSRSSAHPPLPSVKMPCVNSLGSHSLAYGEATHLANYAQQMHEKHIKAQQAAEQNWLRVQHHQLQQQQQQQLHQQSTQAMNHRVASFFRLFEKSERARPVPPPPHITHMQPYRLPDLR